MLRQVDRKWAAVCTRRSAWVDRKGASGTAGRIWVGVRSSESVRSFVLGALAEHRGPGVRTLEDVWRGRADVTRLDHTDEYRLVEVHTLEGTGVDWAERACPWSVASITAWPLHTSVADLKAAGLRAAVRSCVERSSVC